ncbi:MAG: hypothetical protein R3D26_10720 [Cyanobacteriota/Melainabacteria group bacterium]
MVHSTGYGHHPHPGGRAAIHADGGGVNSQLLKEAYKEATGRDLNENWMRTA